MGKGYRTLSIPEDLYREVERFIKDRPEKGYSGVTEFFKEALRKHLREVKNSRQL